MVSDAEDSDRLASGNGSDEASPEKGGSPALAPGTMISRFMIIQELGRGGMGVVYRAYDSELDRSIALKLVSTKSEADKNQSNYRIRLLREAKALAQLSHPNVVTVHDVGTLGDDAYVFLAMEYVEGNTLNKWLMEEHPSREALLSVLVAAGRGLAAAHAAGLIHRDFKPDNVMVGKDGRVRVLDFGLARVSENKEKTSSSSQPELTSAELRNSSEQSLTDSSSSAGRGKFASKSGSSDKVSLSSITLDGVLVGTPAYMAPEQVKRLPADEFTDQYSFCATLYECFYRSKPFSGKNLRELFKNITKGRIILPSNRSEVPEWIERIILRGMSLNPHSRYPSMEALLEDLTHDPTVALQQRREARLRALVVGGLVFLVCLVLFGGLYFRATPDRVCQEAPRLVQSVWNPSIALQMQQVFEKTGLAYAKDTYKRVQANLDRYANQWIQMHIMTCEASYVYHTQSDVILDLKMACLEDKLDKMAALVDIFVKGSGETLVQRAADASASLSDLKICQDREALTSDLPENTHPELRPKIALLRKNFNRLEALKLAVQVKAGVQLAEENLRQASEIDIPTLKADALFIYGYFLDGAGEYDRAIAVLQEAIDVAIQAKEGRTAGQALTIKMWVIGYELQNHEQASQLITAAEVALGLGHKDPMAEALLYNTKGSLSFVAERYPEALRDYKKAYETNLSVLGEYHPKLGTNLNNIGLTLAAMEDWEQANQYYQKALEVYQRAVGPEHPLVAVTYFNLGMLHYNNSKPYQAIEELEKSLAIDRANLGNAQPKVADTLAMIAVVRLSIGDVQGAIGLYTRAQSICRDVDCLAIASSFGDCQFNLAKELWTRPSHRQKALELAREAKATFSKLAADKDALAKVEEWLAKRDSQHLLSKNTANVPVKASPR